MLAERRVLAYRVMALDDTPVEHYPVEALASFTTHDLPTLAGFWSGRDLADQERLGHGAERRGHPRGPGPLRVADRRRRQPPRCDEVARRAHATLARAPSRIVVAQLEDAPGVAERPNMPGTTDGWPNWSLALPEPIEAVLGRPLTGEISHTLATPQSGPDR